MMRRLLIIFAGLQLNGSLGAQVIQGGEEEQLEQMASGAEENVPEEGGQLPFKEGSPFRTLGINQASLEDFLKLPGMTVRHAEAIISYRNHFGPFIHLMELQAVPGLGTDMIRQILPFLRLGLPNGGHPRLRERLKGGEHFVLLRTSQAWEVVRTTSSSRTSSSLFGRGSSLLFRYGYRFGNHLQWGIAMEKDAGERLIPSALWRGMDFTSFHIAARNLGPIKTLVVGDFILNLGQGLIHWQGMAFSKSSNAMMVNRQGEMLRPYSGIDENRFHRGIGVELGGSKFGGMFCIAGDRMDGNRVFDSARQTYSSVSSFQWTGLHRTEAEIADKDAIRQRLAGGRFYYRRNQLIFGVNGVAYFFNRFVERGDAPYQIFNVRGRRWWNLSADYSFVLRNVYMFGEIGLSPNRGLGLVHGIIASLDSRLDFSMVFRSISPSFKSIQSNAFTELSAPSNETGLYLGMQFRPIPRIVVNAYVDGWHHPWLRYRMHAPSNGRSGLLAISWKPSKLVEVTGTIRLRKDMENTLNQGSMIASPVFRTLNQYRFQVSFKPNRFIEVRQRADLAFSGSSQKQRGWAQSFEIIGQEPKGQYSVAARVTWFSSDAYETRTFQYERDVLNYYSISSLNGQGIRAYLVFNGSLPGKISLQGKVFCTLYNDLRGFGGYSQGAVPVTKWGFRVQGIRRF